MVCYNNQYHEHNCVQFVYTVYRPLSVPVCSVNTVFYYYCPFGEFPVSCCETNKGILSYLVLYYMTNCTTALTQQQLTCSVSVSVRSRQYRHLSAKVKSHEK